MEHTKGPWEVSEPDDNGQPIVRAEHYEVATCWHHCVGSIEKEAHANAALIAAAPDLLEALKAAVASQDQNVCNSWISQALAAVAKAEGSP